jgi:nicotinamidase-related amidase
MTKRTALLLIDMQNDYFPGGRMELCGPEQAARNGGRILRFFRKKELPVIHIAHESVRPGASFFLPGTTGQQIHELVAPLATEAVITKNYPNSFLQTNLQQTLTDQAVKHVVIVGMMTHMCVDATCRAAKDLGFACTLIHDATATRNLGALGREVAAEDVQTAFIAALSAVCDQVLDTQTLLEDLDREL